MESLILSYFQDLFYTSTQHGTKSALDAVDVKVTPVMNAELLKPYSIEEVRDALFQMYPMKALGLDGLYPLFFKKY